MFFEAGLKTFRSEIRSSYRPTDRPGRQVKTETALFNCLRFPSFFHLEKPLSRIYVKLPFVPAKVILAVLFRPYVGSVLSTPTNKNIGL